MPSKPLIDTVMHDSQVPGRLRGSGPRRNFLAAALIVALAPLAGWRADDAAAARPAAPPVAPPVATPPPAPAAPPVFVLMTTSKGDIVLELNPDKAPLSVDNFLEYAKDGFYEGTVFHRVIPSFMIQGGGFTPDLKPKAPRPPIKNESGNGLKNDRGTIAMARLPQPDTATSQFFINVRDNASLNREGNPPGYAVFGKVIVGMDVVDAIKVVPTKRVGPHEAVPVDAVTITKVTTITAEEAAKRVAAAPPPAPAAAPTPPAAPAAPAAPATPPAKPEVPAKPAVPAR